ncbi:MAG: ATP-dependent RecD-like DNA helicase [Clostridia bacterium]|nr:ATP-dependent RecD-like DNA helicase [Clostridia bacterium]
MDTSNEIVIHGTVLEIIFENEDNGYKICDILCNGTDTVTARGTLPFLYVGEYVTFTGHFENHKVYGDQFIVTGYGKELPVHADEIEIFLSSGLIEGVGPATAKAIVKKFGEDTVQVILHAPEKLECVRGISHARALRIGETFQEYEATSELIVYFNQHGISTGLALKIYQKYGILATEIVQKNPYRLIDDIPEIGFKTADRLGQSIGIALDAGSRICAGILHILSLALGGGHVFLPEPILIRETAQLLNVSESLIEPSLDTLEGLHKILCLGAPENRQIFLSYMDLSEKYVADRLYEHSLITTDVSMDRFEKNMQKFQRQAGIHLDDAQRDAILQSCLHGFSIITGGPGTGKTTIINALVHLLTGMSKKCVLAAPTGRAAKRMAETCGLPAKTIHRLLEFTSSGREFEGENDLNGGNREDFYLKFGRNEQNPLDVNVLIVDETSMLDTLLLYHLLKATPKEAQIIFVGDQNQLPSVGPGNVLKDLISTGLFRTTVLSKIYRQEDSSMIAYNAHKVNGGLLPETNQKDSDFFFLPRKTSQDVMQTLIDVVCRRLPNAYGIDPMKDVQVLIPNKKGYCGVMNANVLLQQELNPARDGLDEFENSNGVFRRGDRVMQTKNNYEITWIKKDTPGVEGKGIFNGEMGVIQGIDKKNKTVDILFDDDRFVTYDFPTMNQIEHCYAITVHKSQGSEFDYCVIPLLSGPPMLMTRNILYTAITRAKKMVVLIGDGQCMENMIANNTQQARYTYLAERIIERGRKNERA